MITRFVRRILFWFHARRHAADLAAEIEQHRARAQAALEASGLSPAEAAAVMVFPEPGGPNISNFRRGTRPWWRSRCSCRCSTKTRFKRSSSSDGTTMLDRRVSE